MKDHAVARYSERVLGANGVPIPEAERIAERMRGEIVSAEPLSPIARSIFADPRRGVSPSDEYRVLGATVFVLSRPRRGGDITCVTVIVATPAQLETMRTMLDREVQHPAPQLETATQNRSPHLDAHADAFCLAYATYFNIEHPPVIERIRAAIDALPTTLTELQRLARRIQQRTGGPDIDRDGLRYFWAEYAKRMPRNA